MARGMCDDCFWQIQCQYSVEHPEEWVVFVLSVLFTILTCDNVTKCIGEWFKIISCIIVLLGAFYFVTGLFCFWVKEMTS